MLPSSAQPLLVAMFKSAGHEIADDADFEFDFDVDFYSGCDTCGHGESKDVTITVWTGTRSYYSDNTYYYEMRFDDMGHFLRNLMPDA